VEGERVRTTPVPSPHRRVTRITKTAYSSVESAQSS